MQLAYVEPYYVHPDAREAAKLAKLLRQEAEIRSLLSACSARNDPPKRGRGRPCKYPWATMGVGESFRCKAPGIRANAIWAGRRYGREFSVIKSGLIFTITRLA